MDFTENTIRTGQSVVGDYRLDYSITYNKDKLMKIEAHTIVKYNLLRVMPAISFMLNRQRNTPVPCPEHQLKYAPLYWQILRKQLPN